MQCRKSLTAKGGKHNAKKKATGKEVESGGIEAITDKNLAGWERLALLVSAGLAFRAAGRITRSTKIQGKVEHYSSLGPIFFIYGS